MVRDQQPTNVAMGENVIHSALSTAIFPQNHQRASPKRRYTRQILPSLPSNTCIFGPHGTATASKDVPCRAHPVQRFSLAHPLLVCRDLLFREGRAQKKQMW
jgi:hypothetical protein